MSSQLFSILYRNTTSNTKARDDAEYWYYLSDAKVQFPECGSFCFLIYCIGPILILKSNLLKENAVKKQTPAVWGNDTLWLDDTSYNHRFFQVGWRDESAMVKLYQTPDRVQSIGFCRSAHKYLPSKRTVLVTTISTLPAHLAHAREVYLLAGKSGNDLTRLLILPREGPPEVKYLRVTLNQILDELAKSPRAYFPGGINWIRSSLSDWEGYTEEEVTSDTRFEEDLVSIDEDECGP